MRQGRPGQCREGAVQSSAQLLHVRELRITHSSWYMDSSECLRLSRSLSTVCELFRLILRILFLYLLRFMSYGMILMQAIASSLLLFLFIIAAVRPCRRGTRGPGRARRGQVPTVAGCISLQHCSSRDPPLPASEFCLNLFCVLTLYTVRHRTELR